MSHKALSSAALLRGRPDGVVVNTSALESRGRGFKSRSGQFVGFSLCVCLYIYIYIYIYICIYYNENYSRLQMYFIALLLQLCFVWPKDDHTLQAMLANDR